MKRLFLIGAMKCGTSSLAAHLAAHPEIYMPQVKEPRFFLNEHPEKIAWERYEALFAPAGASQWQLDATTGYSKWPQRDGVPSRIHQRCPDARFVYIVRDPIDRVYSHYLHNFGCGREPRSFGAAVRACAEYIDISRYHRQICEYLKHFHRDQLYVVVLEEFMRDPLPIMTNLFRFLEIADDYQPPDLNVVHNSRQSRAMLPPRLQRVAFLTSSWQRRLGQIPLIGTGMRWAGKPLAKLQQSLPEKSAIRDANAEAYLWGVLQPDVDRMEEFLSRRLAHWKTANRVADTEKIEITATH